MSARLVKRLEFNEDARARMLASDPAKIRLNNDFPDFVAVTLTEPFTLALDAVMRSPETTLGGLTTILGLDVDADVPADTSLGFRVRFGAAGVDGVLYWDGLAWSAATDDDHWNDAQTVNDNLPELLPLPSRTLAFDMNLRSTTGLATPVVRSVGLLAVFHVEWWDDLIYDTVVRALQSSLHATTDFLFEVSSSTNLIDLSTTYRSEQIGHNLRAALEAYDLTDDPQKLNNLASGYTPGVARSNGSNEPGQVALSATVPAGHALLLRMEYAPEIAVNTSQDYYEPERLPAVIFERIFQVPTTDGSSRNTDTGDDGEVYKNKADFTGVLVPSPRQQAVRFDYAIWAQSSSDEARLLSAVERWIANHPILRTYALDEEVRVSWDRGAERAGTSDRNDVRVSTGGMLLRGVQFWLRDAIDVSLIANFSIDITTLPPEAAEP